MKSQPQDFSSLFIFILSRHMQCLFYLVRQTFIFRTKVCSFALLKVRDYIYIYIYSYAVRYSSLAYKAFAFMSKLSTLLG